MSYTPPPGSNASLIFDGAYTPPTGNAIILDLAADNPLNVREASVSSTLDAVTTVIVVGSSTFHPVTITATLADAVAVIAAGSLHQVTLAATLDAVTAVISAVAHEPANATIAVTLDAVTAVIAAVAHEPANATIEATLDDSVIAITAGTGVKAQLSAMLDEVVAAVAASWQSGVWRGVEFSRQNPHVDNTNPVRRQTKQVFNQGAITDQTINSGSAKPAPVLAINQSSWFIVDRKHVDKASGWDKIAAKSRASAFVYQASERKALYKRVTWQPGQPFRTSLSSAYQSPPRKALATVNRYDEAEQLRLSLDSSYELGTRTFRRWNILPWEVANPHSWIFGDWRYPPQPFAPGYVPSTALVLQCKKPARVTGGMLELIFRYTGCPWDVLRTIPIQRSYFVSNTATIVTLPDLIPLDVTQITISADMDSWCWSFSATLPGSQQLGLILPGNDGSPVEVLITINGQSWQFLVESYGHNRMFARSGISIQGRSSSAWLADPFAIISDSSNSADISAQQIADQSVLYTGWTIDWQLTDWLVPAGAWSHRGTPMTQLTTLAEAVGAVVQSAPQTKSLSLIKRYPVLPWNFLETVPYAQIPPDIVLNMAVKWLKKPAYNAVYVSGEGQGVTARVIRAGSAGDNNAPMKVNPLLTHSDAARMSGESILADTGAQGDVSLTLPIEGMVGMIPPGKLIEITEPDAWLGLTRGITINANFSFGLTVRQQLDIERHYG
jgi:hypothetical protein